MAREDGPGAVGEQVAGPEEARIAPRTNMFIAAILHEAGGSCPVRIRNLSRSGALVEGPALPPAGSAVALVRSGYRATGHIAWVDGGRCGIRLDSAVSVADWMARQTEGSQDRVDRMIADVRAAPTARPIAPAAHAPLNADLRCDVDRLRLIIETMGDELVREPETLIRHAGIVQHLDIAAQMLDALRQAVDPDTGLRRSGLLRLLRLRPSGDEALGRAA